MHNYLNGSPDQYGRCSHQSVMSTPLERHNVGYNSIETVKSSLFPKLYDDCNLLLTANIPFPWLKVATLTEVILENNGQHE